MPAPKGNRFWEARSSHGRNPIFETPEKLWAVCCEYFEWVENNPLYEAKAFSYQGDVVIEYLPKMRAMTLNALCVFINIGRRTWDDYREREDFLPVICTVETIIYQQKFEGAAADLLNANIISRDLGLGDKTTITQQPPEDVTDEEIEQRIQQAAERLARLRESSKAD